MELSLSLINELKTATCKLNFQETMTFIFALSFIIYSISHFFRTLNEKNK